MTLLVNYSISEFEFITLYDCVCLLFTVGDIHFDDINLEKSYAPFKAYAQSKLANVLFTKQLALRLKGIFF